MAGTGRRSTGWAAPGFVRSWPAPACCTASGCAARAIAQAREQLRTAHGLLDEIGMEAFAERARRELLATGETARRRAAQAAAPASEQLTPQEAQVARLARDGLSNPEIGARLFLSSHTVQYHLTKVFAKLGITSRGQLHRILTGGPDAPGH
jgi:DNA-binding NarL/FixJ family response regulator